MRQTVSKLAVNKAHMISLSAQMTEQLGRYAVTLSAVQLLGH